MRKKLAYSTKKSKIRVYATRSNCVETPFERAYLVFDRGRTPYMSGYKNRKQKLIGWLKIDDINIDCPVVLFVK